MLDRIKWLFRMRWYHYALIILWTVGAFRFESLPYMIMVLIGPFLIVRGGVWLFASNENKQSHETEQTAEQK